MIKSVEQLSSANSHFVATSKESPREYLVCMGQILMHGLPSSAHDLQFSIKQLMCSTMCSINSVFVVLIFRNAYM
jgi:hypothetical protein